MDLLPRQPSRLPPVSGRRRWLAAAYALAGLLLLLTFLLGPFIFVPLTFIVPVSLVAWHAGRRPAALLGAGLAVFRFVLAVYVWRDSGIHPVAAAANLSMLLMVLVAASWVVDRAASVYPLMHRIKTLEGLLSICSYCKRIHRRDGSWEQFETYIASHSDAQFSHGICPDCARQHFPEVFRGIG